VPEGQKPEQPKGGAVPASVIFAAMAGFVIPGSEGVDLAPSANGIAYQLYVHVPPACREPQAECPAIYTLDAEYSSGLSALITTHLIDRNRIPPVVTVSIGYPDKSQYRLNRSRDYTPYFFPTGGHGEETQAVSGGGPAFRTAIRDDIIPWVEGHFPVAPGNRTLVGHSYGGLFAVSTLMAEPDLFDSYVIVSPSLWYGDGRFLEEVRAFEPAPRETPITVYLAVGEYEEQPENGRAMVSDARALADEFARWGEARVRFAFTVMPGETHASIFPGAYSNGIRAIFQ
jgi:hypothetical protein